MKKTLIAVAALAATGAFAQVSVYGRLDVGYSNTTYTAQNGTETKLNGVTSNNSVTNMWGIKGSSDLGGGMKADVKLEMDLYPANGTIGQSGSLNGVNTAAAPNPANGFNRISTIGVSGAFGSIGLGRDYTPMFSLIASTDVFAQSRLSTVNRSTAGGGSTLPNQIIYRSPSMSGFEGQLSYNNTDTSSGTTDAKEQGNTIALKYSNGPLMVGVAAGSQENTAGATVTKVSGTALAASYNFGSFRLMGNSITGKTTTNGVDGNDNKEINLGFAMPLGKVTLLAGIGNNDNGAAANNTGQDMVLGVDYALSATTAFYAKTGTVNKFGDNKTTGTTVGIKTTF